MGQQNIVRFLHFSDVHITVRNLKWQWTDWFTKRVPGWINLKWMGRESRFNEAEEVLAALAKEIRLRRPDHVIFSGDATALGFEEEIKRAITVLDASGPGGPPGLAVPGNHDYYTRQVADSGLFERYFASWQEGKRVGPEIYPFAQRVGHVWLVAVNSATGNHWFWDASGSVGGEQLARLEKLLAGLDAGPRFLVTHFPISLKNGRPETRFHGLRDLADLIKVATRGGVCLWLHGHRHGPYHHIRTDIAPFPAICAGSATQRQHWSYGEYTVQDRTFHALRRSYSVSNGAFQDGETFELELASS
jgi:3',5'-cyclic AMP phosphodiesterase CpdA